MKISILGSTGSIGTQTLQVADKLGISVGAITGNKNTQLLEAQARRYIPDIIAVYDDIAADDLKVRLGDMSVRIISGEEGLIEAAVHPEADTVVTAVSGSVGLKPTLAAIHEEKRIALANKETLVCAGSIVMEEADCHGVDVIPVDSEHSAIFQCIGQEYNPVKRIL